jgi:hypothetical protein
MLIFIKIKFTGNYSHIGSGTAFDVYGWKDGLMENIAIDFSTSQFSLSLDKNFT